MSGRVLSCEVMVGRLRGVVRRFGVYAFGVPAFGILAVVLVSCGSEPVEDATVPVSDAVVADTSTSLPAEPATPPAGQPPVGVVGPSEEEIQAMMPDVPVTTMPEAGVQALRASQIETQTFFAACLAESGFASELTGVRLVVDVADDQWDRYNEVASACREEMFATFEQFQQEIDPALVYRAYLYVRECMIQEGYRVTDPPTLDVFLETYHTRPWHPYDAYAKGGLERPGEFQKLEETCPQDVWYLVNALGLTDDQP